MVISLAKINEALQHEDIEGLLALGAPNDEYSAEAKAIEHTIRSLSNEQIDENILLSIIEKTWIRFFGPFLQEDLAKRFPIFQNVVKRILS